MKVFFTTASISSHVTNEILISSAFKHAQKFQKLKLVSKDNVCRKVDLIMALSLGVIFLLLQGIYTAIFLRKNIATISYRGVSVGRYATATAYRSYNAYSYRLVLIARYLKSLLKCGLYCEIAERLAGNIEALYLDHGCYENGVFYDVMAMNSVPIYHNQYPYSLIKFLPKSPGSFEDCLFIPDETISDKATAQGRSLMSRVIKNPSAIPYMLAEQTNYGSKSEYDYVIYSHSFTDAQLYYGYDSIFNNVMEWLEYTVETLKGKKICIKAHPEIFTEGYATDVADWDRRLFAELSNKYFERANIDIIDRPVSNVDFLNNINKSAVLVTHHGNAILEGGVLGFKCICSSTSNWKNFDIFNTWSTEDEYRQLLSSSAESLKSTNIYEMDRYNYLLRSVPQSYLSPTWWVHQVCEITDKKPSDIIKDPHCLDSLDDCVRSQCINQISDSLITV